MDPALACTKELLHGRLWNLRKVFIFESVIILVYIGVKYCDYGKVNYNMLRDIQRELRKLKGKGEDLGHCLTDGLNHSLGLEKNKSFPDPFLRGYPVVYPLEGFNDDLSEEEIFTDDSSDTGEESVSGSESEDDPTFMLDVSCSQDPDTQIPYSTKDSCHSMYNLRPRKTAVPVNEVDSRRLPSPKTFSDLILNLTRSTTAYSVSKKPMRSGTGKAMFSSDEEV